MTIWHTPEEIIEIGFQHSRVVMMNEAHSGLKRCIRTRRIGQKILPTAHGCGDRHLAMETLHTTFADECNRTRHVPLEKYGGYLAQAEMIEFIQAALNRGWTLIPYEADSRTGLGGDTRRPEVYCPSARGERGTSSHSSLRRRVGGSAG